MLLFHWRKKNIWCYLLQFRLFFFFFFFCRFWFTIKLQCRRPLPLFLLHLVCPLTSRVFSGKLKCKIKSVDKMQINWWIDYQHMTLVSELINSIFYSSSTSFGAVSSSQFYPKMKRKQHINCGTNLFFLFLQGEFLLFDRFELITEVEFGSLLLQFGKFVLVFRDFLESGFNADWHEIEKREIERNKW